MSLHRIAGGHPQQVDPAEYHGRKATVPRGDIRRPLSQGDLKRIYANPWKWRHDTRDDKRTRSLDFGSLVDCLLTTPSLFDRTFVAEPPTYMAAGSKKADPPVEKPWNNNATVCREWVAEQAAAGRTVVKPELIHAAMKARDVVRAHDWIPAMIETAQSQVQVLGEWHDEATGLTVPVCNLVDWLPGDEWSRIVFDLKTAADASGDWGRVVVAHGYDVQLALAVDLLNLYSEDRQIGAHVIVESHAPYAVATAAMDSGLLDRGRTIYRRALRYYCEGMAGMGWRGYDELQTGFAVQGMRLVSAPIYATIDDYEEAA